MTGNGENKDLPKTMRNTVLEDSYIREFDQMMKETREFHRQYDEQRRRRGFL